MKTFVILLLTFLSVTINAQSFTAVADTTSAQDTLNSEMVFNITVTNVSDNDLTLYVKRTVNNIPLDWTSSLCFNFCFSPDLDSIATTSDFGSRSLSAGESRELSLHIFPHSSSGTGNVSLRIGDVNNFADSVVIDFTAIANPLGVEDENRSVFRFELNQNYPNPFYKGSGENSTTTITYSVKGITTTITLTVYDVLGRKVATLVNNKSVPNSGGNYSVQFNPNSADEQLPTGIYFYRLQAGKFSQTKKMILMK